MPSATQRSHPPQHVDVLIVGAGISGINAAYRVQSETSCSYAVIEARHEMGGTWSLFKYPGIRSDSDMFTLGFAFAPWRQKKIVADGKDICDYVKTTAHTYGIDKKIEYNRKLVQASWSSATCSWTVTVQDTQTGEETKRTAGFVVFASGYYDYNEGHYPDIAGAKSFNGHIVQPQFWPASLDYSGKRVVIIGSGATAVTLVPNMAKTAGHVTLLQRSPSYFFALPSVDPLAALALRWLPIALAGTLIRLYFNAQLAVFYHACRLFPNAMARLLKYAVRRQLPPDVAVDPHFTPSYKPWDQRVCIVPDGDMFATMRAGKASVATGHIDRITAHGVRLQSGQEIDADVIVQATGLKWKLLGGCRVDVDGKVLDVSKRMIFKGQMLDGVPNMSLCFGYSNASWSLGSDLCARYVCGLLNHMRKHGHQACRPRLSEQDRQQPLAPLTNLSSGYIQRAQKEMPQSSGKKPWAMRSNYFMDYMQSRLSTGLNDGIEFTTASLPS